MKSTQHRMIAVAIVVCGFAVGMAGLLNFFKYRTTANRIVAERLIVTGKSVENNIQSSLALGLHFADIGTLPDTLDRERSTDHLILVIDIFDKSGKMLYSTDRLRASRSVPDAWLAAATRDQNNWVVDDGSEAAAGIDIKNNFGLTIGYLAVRYSGDLVREAAATVGREIAFSALLVFLLSAGASSAAVLVVTRRLDKDLAQVADVLRSTDARAAAKAANGPFGAALQRFMQTTQSAERDIADLRVRLNRGSGT